MALQSATSSSPSPIEGMAEALRLADGASIVSHSAASAASPTSEARHSAFLPIHTRQKIAKDSELVESIELR